MNSLPYVDQLVREYLLFRGFTGTLRSLDHDRRSDKAFGFRPERVVGQLLECVRVHDLDTLVSTWRYLSTRFFSKMPPAQCQASERLRVSLLKHYAIYAVRKNKKEQLVAFLERLGGKIAVGQIGYVVSGNGSSIAGGQERSAGALNSSSVQSSMMSGSNGMAGSSGSGPGVAISSVPGSSSHGGHYATMPAGPGVDKKNGANDGANHPQHHHHPIGASSSSSSSSSTSTSASASSSLHHASYGGSGGGGNGYGSSGSGGMASGFTHFQDQHGDNSGSGNHDAMYAYPHAHGNAMMTALDAEMIGWGDSADKGTYGYILHRKMMMSGDDHHHGGPSAPGVYADDGNNSISHNFSNNNKNNNNSSSSNGNPGLPYGGAKSSGVDPASSEDQLWGNTLDPAEWRDWFVLPFIADPAHDPRFEPFFHRAWEDTLARSLYNFFSSVFRSVPLPRLLNFNVARLHRKSLECQVESLRAEVGRLVGERDAMEARLTEQMQKTAEAEARERALAAQLAECGAYNANNSNINASINNNDINGIGHIDHNAIADQSIAGAGMPSDGGDKQQQQRARVGLGGRFVIPENRSDAAASACAYTPNPNDETGDEPRGSFEDGYEEDAYSDADPDGNRSKGKVKEGSRLFGRHPMSPPRSIIRSGPVAYQESFTGHDSPVTQCSFSPGGDILGTATRDGTVRLWPFDAFPADATGFGCTAEVASMEWVNAKVVLCGTADGCVRDWDAGQGRKVLDAHGDARFPRIAEIVQSPARADEFAVCSLPRSFMSAASSPAIARNVNADIAAKVSAANTAVATSPARTLDFSRSDENDKSDGDAPAPAAADGNDDDDDDDDDNNNNCNCTTTTKNTNNDDDNVNESNQKASTTDSEGYSDDDADDEQKDGREEKEKDEQDDDDASGNGDGKDITPRLQEKRGIPLSPSSDSGGGGGTLSIWSLRAGGPITTLPTTTSSPLTAAFNHNSTLLAAGMADGTVAVFDQRSNSVIKTWTHSRAHPVTALEFSADDTAITVATGGGGIARRSLFREDHVERVYARETDAIKDPLTSLSSRSSSSSLESPEEDGNDAGNDLEIFPAGFPVKFAFSPDGAYLVAGSAGDGRAAVFAAKDGRDNVLLRLPEQGNGISCVDWHPEEPAVLTGSHDASVRLAGLRNLDRL